MDTSDDSDTEIKGNEYEELCRNCDRLCHKLAEPIVPIEKGYKKDSRVWLHKNPGFKCGLNQQLGNDDSSDCLYTIIDMFGRKFKKDSRTWLHKSSRKRQRSAQIIEIQELDVGCKTVKKTLTETIPERIAQIESNRLDFHGVLKNKNFHPSNIIRKRKRRRQLSYSANNSPREFRYNEEICRILSKELVDNKTFCRPTVRGAVSEELFEVFENDEEEDDDDCETYRQKSDINTDLTDEWRDSCVVTSDTSTQSSNDTQQNSINQSPLSSGASINLSTDNFKRSPTLTSTATNFYCNFQQKSMEPLISSEQLNLDCDIPPPGSPWSTVNSSNFSDNNCPIQHRCLYRDATKLNLNSRSVCFLIAESDEFLAESNLSDYEEESDEGE